MVTDKSLFPEHTHVVPPYEHQRKEFEKTRSWEYYAFFWEMGTGKTKPLLDTAVWLFLNQEIDGLLIVSDKGSYLNWPVTEIPKHVQQSIPLRIAVWRSVMDKKQREKSENILVARDNLFDIACINVEALSTQRGYDWARKFLQSHHGMMIVDESTSIKNPKSLRSRACHVLGRIAEYRRIATGTPVTQGPLDLYSQCEFLKPQLLHHASYSSFQCRYSIMRDVIMGTRRFKQVVGYANLEELETRLRDFSSRITKNECLDLPEKIYETQYIEMSQEQLQIYTRLKDEAIVLLDSGMLSALSAITTIEKLHQICCGHVRDDEGNINDIPNNRIETLLTLLENISDKVIVWCHYQRDVELVISALANNPDGYAVHYYGKTTQDERVTAIDRFVNDARCKWFVGSPATGGKGITLTVANYVVYYSCGYNLEHRLQSEDRAHRIGQKRAVTYIDLQTVGTLEKKILDALKDKRDLAHEILDKNRLRETLTNDDDLL